jgi:hypothetical protein
VAARRAGQSGGVGTEAVAGVGRGNGPVSGGGGDFGQRLARFPFEGGPTERSGGGAGGVERCVDGGTGKRGPECGEERLGRPASAPGGRGRRRCRATGEGGGTCAARTRATVGWDRVSAGPVGSEGVRASEAAWRRR